MSFNPAQILSKNKTQAGIVKEGFLRKIIKNKVVRWIQNKKTRIGQVEF